MSRAYGCRTRGGTRGDSGNGERFGGGKGGRALIASSGAASPPPRHGPGEAVTCRYPPLPAVSPRRGPERGRGTEPSAARRSAAAESEASPCPSVDPRYFKYSASLLLFINFPSTHRCMPLKITWQTGSRLSLLSWDLIQLNKCTFTFASIRHERGELCGLL